MANILYIDDNPDDLEYALYLFREKAIAITGVKNIKDAFGLMEKNAYDVIICDMCMPGNDGRDFAKELTDSHIETPFILTSGAESLQGFGHYKGFRNYLGFILKPITPEKISSLMEGNK